MSAICGIFSRRQQTDIAHLLSKMLSSLAHRGIDGQDEWYTSNVGFGLQALWVTPESVNEKLPYHDPDSGLSIVANLRLDNRKELLKILNCHDTCLTDSQLVLLSYQAWGEDAVKQLKGDFVISIWDERKQRLILMTDHCGLRSVYYYLNDDYFAFASEIKALLELPFVEKRPNLKQIAKMDFYLPSDTSGETYFEKIYAIPAATLWSITPTQIASQIRYWQPDPDKRIVFTREEEYLECFQSLFSDAVEARLRSAYPVASTLSGGLDSSAITAMAAKLLAKKNQSLSTYSVVKAPEYADQCVDELEFINHFNDTPNLKRSFISDGWRGPFDNLRQLISAGESPDFTSRHYHITAFIEKMKVANERVLLNGRYGEAGPSFNGAGYYSELLLTGRIGKLIDELRLRARTTPFNYLRFIKSHVLRPMVPFCLLSPRIDLLRKQTLSHLRPEFKATQLGAQLKQYSRESLRVGQVKPNHRHNQYAALNAFIQEQKARFTFCGHEHIENVYPFLDKSLIEFCLAIPGDLKISAGYPRSLIRAGMRGIMPEAICNRLTKRPFSPDYRFRYNRQREQARQVVNEVNHSSLIHEMINLDQLKRDLAIEMPNNQILTEKDFISMISIPHTIYLISFLQLFFL